MSPKLFRELVLRNVPKTVQGGGEFDQISPKCIREFYPYTQDTTTPTPPSTPTHDSKSTRLKSHRSISKESDSDFSDDSAILARATALGPVSAKPGSQKGAAWSNAGRDAKGKPIREPQQTPMKAMKAKVSTKIEPQQTPMKAMKAKASKKVSPKKATPTNKLLQMAATMPIRKMDGQGKVTRVRGADLHSYTFV